jgi:hypothetical protein
MANAISVAKTAPRRKYIKDSRERGLNGRASEVCMAYLARLVVLVGISCRGEDDKFLHGHLGKCLVPNLACPS